MPAFWLKSYIEEKSTNNREILFKMKKFHSILGFFLYIIGKANVLIGLVYAGYWNVFFVCLGWTILTLINLSGFMVKI